MPQRGRTLWWHSHRDCEVQQAGAGTDPRKHAQEEAKFEVLARTTPERAADRIVRGVLQGETRILIGLDATLIDLFQRLLPERYWRIMGPLLDWRIGRALAGGSDTPKQTGVIFLALISDYPFPRRRQRKTYGNSQVRKADPVPASSLEATQCKKRGQGPPS